MPQDGRSRGQAPQGGRSERRDARGRLCCFAPKSGSWTAKMVRPLTDKGVGTPRVFPAQDFHTFLPWAGRDAADQCSRPLPRVHQRQARRPRPADPGLDQLLGQAAELPDLRRRATCSSPATISSTSGWATAGYRSQMMWRAQPARSTPGATRSAPSPSSRSAASSSLTTDTSWQSGLMPILKCGIYFGESYDARAETAVATDGSAAWSPTSIVQGASFRTRHTPVQELEPFSAVACFDRCRGPHRLRFRPEHRRLRQPSPCDGERGAKVVVEHAESPRQRGPVLQRQLCAPPRRASNTSLKGEGDESYSADLHLLRLPLCARDHRSGKAEIVDRSRRSRSARRSQPTGSFTSASPLVNRLVENTIWSQRAQLHRSADRLPAARRAASAGPATRRCSPATACYLARQPRHSRANICAT